MSRPARALQFRVPRIAESAVERARLAVVPRTRTRAPRFPFLFLVSVMLVAGVVGLLLFNTQMQKAAFGGRQMEAERAALTVRNQELSQELQELRSYQTIAEKAQALGMVVPASVPFLDVTTGTVNGEVTTATVQDRVNLNRAPGTDPYRGIKDAARRAAERKEAARVAAEKAAALKAARAEAKAGKAKAGKATPGKATPGKAKNGPAQRG